MNLEKLYNYFKSNFDLNESTNGWYRLNNPFDNKGGFSMGVNFSVNRIICHRTGYKSSIIDFLRILHNKNYREIYDIVDKYTEVNFNVTIPIIHKTTTVSLPESFYLFDEDALLSSRASLYLKSRNIDLGLLRERSIGFCNSGSWFGRIIIPFMNPNLQYYVGRDFIGQKPKYKNPKTEDVGIGKSSLFYNEQALDYSKVFLVEGIFDALTCGEFGIASLGWNLSQTQRFKLLSSNAIIHIIPDKGFYDKALITAKSLISEKEVFITNLDGIRGNDINDLGSLKGLHFDKVTWTS